MAVHGMNTVVLFDKYDLGQYLRSTDIDDGTDLPEDTTYGSTSRTYKLGLEEGSFSFEGLYDGDADAVDQVFREAMRAAAGKIASVVIGGNTLGNPARLAKTKQGTYTVAGDVGDLVSITGECQADGGLFSGLLAATHTARTSTANGTGIDNAASTARGYVANLHVTDVSGTDPTLDVLVEHSADGSTWATLATFTQVTAAAAEQLLASSGTVNRHLRITWTIGGTDPSFTFAVTFSRR